MAALLLILLWHPLVFREHERLGVVADIYEDAHC
jgi:hypothetical protein